MPIANFLSNAFVADGTVAIDSLSDQLHVTRTELALATGLSRDAVSKKSRLRSNTTQKRLRDVIEIINHVLPWAGSVQQAFAWYRSQPLPSFGDLTAEDLVKAGRAEDVKAYLNRIGTGGYACGSTRPCTAPTTRAGPLPLFPGLARRATADASIRWVWRHFTPPSVSRRRG
jgi:hypothetical protein